MQFTQRKLSGVWEIQLAPIQDERGFFMRAYDTGLFEQAGLHRQWMQENHSRSERAGIIRGLHFQFPPFAETKLVRCIRGAIWDAAVDVRKGSPTYGQWVAAELTAENGRQLWIPVGFAHGFVTLQPDTEVTYKVTDVYAPDCDGGIRWDDPDIALPWPLPPDGAPVTSPKDGKLPSLAGFDSPFPYDGRPLEPLPAT